MGVIEAYSGIRLERLRKTAQYFLINCVENIPCVFNSTQLYYLSR
jgi:hypothetical protein